MPGFVIVFLLSLFASGVAQALTPVNQASATAQPTPSAIQMQKDILVVGSEQDYPPFAIGMTDAAAGGFTVDLWKAVAAEACLNYTIHVRPFRQILQEFKEGKVDVLINLAQSEERHHFADFTVPHVIVHGAIFVRKGEFHIRSEDDFAGKSIIVLNADLAHDYAVSKGWEKQLVLVDTSAEGMRLLASGKHDAMLLSKLSGMQTLQELGLTSIEALKVKAGFSQKFAFAVPKGQSDLLSKINEGLALTKSNGTYNTLYDKWFGIYEDKEVGLRDLLKYVIPVAVVFMGISGYFFYRRQVEREEAEKKYHDLYDHAPDMYLSVEAKTANILDCNQTLLNTTGYSKKELVGRSVLKIYHPDCADLAQSTFQQFMDTKEVHGVELQLRRKDGSKVDVNLNATAVCDEHGVILHSRSALHDITEHKRAEQSLQRESEKNFALLRNASDGIHILDTDGNIIEVSDSFCAMLGYRRDEMIGMNVIQWDANFTAVECIQVVRQQFTKLVRSQFESRHRHKDGTIIDVEVSGFPLELDGKPALFNSSRNITERKQAEEKLQLAASVFTHAREGIMITAADGTIVDVNNTFTSITGYSRDEALGRNPRFLSFGRQGKAFYDAMWNDLIEKGHWYGEVWNRRKNGEVYAEMLSISAVRDAQGIPRHYVALFSDITLLKEHEQQLEHIAHYDALTSLPNRVLLADRLHQGMTQAQRRGQRLAVAFLDLDGFKAINDNHGHEAGDQLLITVSIRMKQALREGDTLARLGGDEFVAVLVDLEDVAASVPMLTRLLAAAAQPIHVGDLILQVSASLGVSFYPQAEDMDADQLLRQADQAMYQAKLAGKNCYHVFDAELDRSVRGHHESLEHVRHALTAREFVLYYQPKVNMRTGTLIGAEALIRWQHPEKGLLPPVVFLPVIEDHPLAVDIGEWVIDTALTQVELWHAAGLDIPVSVNVGARQLQQFDFVDRLSELLAAHPNVRPGDLELEVLETSALENVTGVSQVIEACREIGVNFALDDFGTGYSSLTYLKRLPVTLLKIDQSFVRDMLGDPDDLAIIEGVVGLVSAFRRQVIAEGVETVEHGTMLLQLGCELAQGYGIAYPMPAHQLPSWSTAWRPDPAWVDLSAVSRNELPVLFASVEHRAWIAAIEAFLKGERDAPMPLDPRQCRFGMWLDVEGLIRYGGQPIFEAIKPLHRQIHALARELCELQTQGRNPEALARLGELHDLRDALLEQLKVLVQKS